MRLQRILPRARHITAVRLMDGRDVDEQEDALVARQREIIGLVTQGMSNTEIADALGLTLGTVKVHLSTIFKKLGVRNRTAAARNCAL